MFSKSLARCSQARKDRISGALEKIQGRLESNKNQLPAELLERLQKALTKGRIGRTLFILL